MILDENKKRWLQIYRSKGVGPSSFYFLYKKYKGKSEDALKELIAKNITIISREMVDKEISLVYNYNANIIFIQDTEYSKLLSTCHNAPPFLTYKGNIQLLNKNSVAIVGSRNASLAGMKITQTLSSDLKDYVIVSGMARGIDRYAHLGAIDRSIAVLGGGIDKIYPLDNKDIYDHLIKNGLIITEYPIGSDPNPSYFHSRNRIIAGLSKATIVVEANLHSGSLITAKYALEYNRDIFAVPGCPLDSRSHGPNSLIQNGAVLIQSAKDVIDNLTFPKIKSSYNENFSTEESLDQSFEFSEAEDCIQSKMLSLLSNIPVTIDQLSWMVNCDIIKTRCAVMTLEIEGKIQRVMGDRVIKI